MAKRKKLYITILILVPLIILFLGARSKQKEEKESPTTQPISALYAERGPYTVGLRNLKIKNEKVLEITIWYPASGDNTLKQEITYPYDVKMGGLGTVSIASFEGQAMSDAALDLSNGPYPLAVLSPGFSIGGTAYAWLAEHLASYGLVVIAPEHHEHLDPESQLWQAAIQRPQDILTVFTYVDQQSKPGGAFEGLIDPETVAVVGHSYGGYTALAAAGAQINTTGLQSHCQNAIEAEHEAAWICEILLPHLTDMSELAELDAIPDDLWPAIADPRVDAIVSMAGDAFFFGDDGLAEMDVPIMVIGGTADKDSPFMWSTYPAYEYSSSQAKVKIALNGAEDMIFTGQCESISWYLKFFSGEFCSDTTWDRGYAHTLTKHFTTAFLLAELKENQEALSELSSEGIDFVDVSFEAKGYGDLNR
jgi:predicted dienelactone hydrolase